MIVGCSFSIPGGVTGEERYVLLKTFMTWSEAQKYCREHHTDLASVRNDEENCIISAVVGSDAAWIGLQRTMSWSDTSRSSFVSWGTSMDGFTMYHQQSCVAIWYKDSGGWAMMHCDQALPFICYKGEFHHTPYQSHSKMQPLLLIKDCG